MSLRLWLLILLLAGAAAAEDARLTPAREALEAGQHVRARELAEAVLEDDSGSAEAHYILGRVYYEAEGSLPRAYYYLSRAEERMDDGELHQQALWLLASVTHDMERYEEALDWIERHDRKYEPKLEPFAGWPLLKLGRADEARRRMKALLSSELMDAKVTALNTLGALEWENGDLEESRDYFVQIVMLYRSMGVAPDVTFLWNKAESELSLGDYAQAEQDLLEAAENPNPLSYSNPWDYLSLIYADQARFPEAVSAVRRMQQWRARTAPALATQSWTEVQTRTATVLLACGYDDAARQLLARLLQRPDRNAGTSDQPYLEPAKTLMLYQESLKLTLERQAEERSWSSGFEWWALLGKSWADRPRLAAARSRAGALIAGNGGLSAALGAYGVHWVVPPWLLPAGVEVFGPGVVAAEARRLLEEPGWGRQRPFLLASLAEARLRQGDAEAALEAAEGALESLPESQVLLKARLTAVRGLGLERLGRPSEAFTAYRQVLERDPGMFRRLGLALPVSFETSGAAAGTAARMLRRSPRFREVEAGFRVSLSEAGGQLEARLLGPDGAVIARTVTPGRGDGVETARALCRSFHEAAFAPRVDLSQTDINSLDGSNAASTAVRERMLDSLGIGKP